jgi:hypothetical protein
MEKEMDFLKNFVQGNVDTKTFEKELYENEKLQKLLDDNNINWGCSLGHTSPYYYLLELNYNDIRVKLEAQGVVKLFFKEKGIDFIEDKQILGQLFSDIKDNVEFRKPYKLSELITIVAKKCVFEVEEYERLGYISQKEKEYDPDNFYYLYTKRRDEIATAELICYAEGYPDVTDEEEEIFPNFVVNEKLEKFCSDEIFESVIGNILHQKKQPTMKNFIDGLNYYLDDDAFIDLEVYDYQ